MRKLLAALGIALLIAGPASADVKAGRVPIDIPAQGLESALQKLAKERDIQVIYRSELVNRLRTSGAKGNLTALEALDKLLDGTGLTFRHLNDQTVTLVPVNGNETAPRGEIPVAMATAVPQPGTVAPTPSGDGVAPSILGGRLTEMSTGGSLAGALVRIMETGRETKTDELGRYRFPPLPPGGYTLYISYLGYMAQTQPVQLRGGEELSFDLSLSQTAADSDAAELVVFGTRSARAQALNRQRTAENNSEVISADTLGEFTGTTLPDALRRVSGVAFMRDENTGEGTNIVIRGLAPDMNAIKLNGLLVPVGNGTDRSPNLSNFLADSVSKITIHKSLLPSHDSAGTGGLVEIETLSPLERSRRYASFSFETGQRGRDFGDEVLGSGTVSGTFGENDSFGLSASAQYRERTTRNIRTTIGLRFGQYLPPGITNSFFLDPRLDFPYESGPGAGDVFVTGTGFSATDAQTSTLAVTLAGEWHPVEHTRLKLDLQRSEGTYDTFGRSANLSFGIGTPLRPVAALGGEPRRALQYNGTGNFFQGYSLLDGQKNTTDTYSLRGLTAIGKWEIDYMVGAAKGSAFNGVANSFNLQFYTPTGSAQPALDPTFISAAAVDPVEGIVITPFGRRSGTGMQLPLLTQAGWDYFNSMSSYLVSNGAVSGDGDTEGSNRRRNASVDVKYDVDAGVLKYVQVGASIDKARFHNRLDDSLQLNGFGFTTNASALGLAFEPADLRRVGIDNIGFSYMSEATVRQFFANLDSYAGGAQPLLSVSHINMNPLSSEQPTDETSFASYLQARVDIGKLEIIGGARLSRVKVDATTLRGPTLIRADGSMDLEFREEFSGLFHDSATQSDLLPRIGLNYRQTDNLVFRGSYAYSTARPRIADLNMEEYVTLNLQPFSGDGTQPSLSIQRGNPGLKPAVTHNVDLDVEYYHDQIGVLKLGGFYKQINNPLEQNIQVNVQDIGDVQLPDHLAFQNLPDNLFISIGFQTNSPEPAKIWGAEASVERQFTFLPGWLSGLGVYANMIYNRSSTRRTYQWFTPTGAQTLVFSGEPLNLAPRTSGTVALTYNRSGIDATLTFGFQNRHLNLWRPNNQDGYAEGVETLDLRTSYYFDWNRMKLRVSLEGLDLLKGTASPDLQATTGGVAGLQKYYSGATFLGGRELRLGLSANF